MLRFSIWNRMSEEALGSGRGIEMMEEACPSASHLCGSRLPPLHFDADFILAGEGPPYNKSKRKRETNQEKAAKKPYAMAMGHENGTGLMFG